MSRRSNLLLLLDIEAACSKILSYTAGYGLNDFLGDDKTADAVIRNFEIIGEAANRLTDDFKDQHRQIDWHKIRGFRNRIVHDYIDIDFEIVWELRSKNIPVLLETISEIIRSIQ
jgi:uncharacterized protein with HEPN domain